MSNQIESEDEFLALRDQTLTLIMLICHHKALAKFLMFLRLAEATGPILNPTAFKAKSQDLRFFMRVTEILYRAQLELNQIIEQNKETLEGMQLDIAGDPDKEPTDA